MTKCLHHLFEAQVQHVPDAIAAVFEGKTLAYSELNCRANALAWHLQALGIGPDKLVAICMERSLAMVIGVLGILKAGGAYVPLDPAYPPERLAFMLEDSQATVLITHDKVKNKLPSYQGHIVNLDTLPLTPDNSTPAVAASSDNLAYIIYTSGSTGKPKGVAMPHGPLVNLMEWQNRNSTLSQGARTLQFSPLSFDVSCQELFATWNSGGTLVLIPEELRRDAPALWRFLAAARIERLFLPFIALQHLAEAARDTATMPPLQEIITAGEQLQITQPIIALLRRLPACVLYNQYGPTESHVVTAHTLTGPPETWPPLPPIGRPITNARIHVLDADLRPVPPGEPGELHIGGDCLARGYLRHPALTAARFIPDPFSSTPGARLYKTGDLARVGASGDIEFLGRIDHQVKVRGFRIELGEIEVALAQHPAIQEAAVVVREDTPGAPRLVAYVVSSQTPPPSATELRRFLGQTMPDYMLPATFVVMDTLPLTPSGKINRRALPSPDNARPALEQAYVAPRNAIEATLARIWADALGLERVGVYDNFFELGGHSLLAGRIVAQLRDAMRVELSMHVIFEAQTVAAVAEYINAVQWAIASQPTGAHPQDQMREEGEL
ncbi:MAG TPA: amino acid adenylation domain-containing protein [Anaerolineae bacterium]|nr:amino acid adenylation domain-containing protein [Anaerolineae bacterium]HQK12801.1 amino acid adenylation domain-containing protein [Anaerolineae bacterium]